MSKAAEAFIAKEFAKARQNARVSLNSLFAGHIKSGAVNNSRQVFPLVDDYIGHGRAAVNDCLSSLDVFHNSSRGRRWKDDLSIVERELDSYLQDGTDIVTKYCGNAEIFAHAIEPYLLEQGEDLNHSIAERRSGWKGSRGKGWHERHPVLYGLAIMLVSVVVSTSIGAIKDQYFAKPAPKAEQAKTSP